LLHLSRDRSRNYAVAREDRADGLRGRSVQQGHDHFRSRRIRHGSQRLFQLRGLDSDPENIGWWGLAAFSTGF
jgi:hypothetical protein